MMWLSALWPIMNAWMAKMLKICVLSQRVPYPPNKGEKLRTFHQIERMVALGHNVEVLSLTESELDKGNATDLAEKLGIQVTTFDLNSRWKQYGWAFLHQQPLSVGAFYSQKLQRTVDEMLNGGCDVLHLTASSLGYYIFHSRYFGQHQCKLLMDMMDVDSDKWEQYKTASRWPMKVIYSRESKGIRKLESGANQHFTQTFLIANEEVILFQRDVANDNPVNVLGNGLDFSSFYPGSHSDKSAEPHFLFTGVMDYKPNIDAVLWFVEMCWPSIRTSLPSAKLTIAGMNPTQQIIALSTTDPQIEVTGFVDDILPYFHKATTFVAPFRIARGVQNKVLQAAACMLPVVSTSMGAEGIAYADKSTMWIANDATDFSNACIEASQDDVTAAEKARLAYQAIKNDYSWEQQLKPLEDVLLKLDKV